MLDKSRLGKGSWLRGMKVLLVAEIPPGEWFAAVAREWFTATLTEVFPELYGELRARPVTGRVRPSARGPLGQPGHALGVLSVVPDAPASRRRSLYSERSWPRFLDRLAKYPDSAFADVTMLDDRGDPVHRLDGSAAVYLTRLGSGWVGFGFTAPAADTGWPDSPGVQERWAGFVREQAARIGACAGGMTDDSDLLFPALPGIFAAGGWREDPRVGCGAGGIARVLVGDDRSA